MKKTNIAAIVLALCTQGAMADHVMPYPGPEAKQGTTADFRPGYCEIEIINNSAFYTHVYGYYDTGATTDFIIYSGERWRIPMFYGYKCHRGMNIDTFGPYGQISSNYIYTDQTLVIDPYFKKEARTHMVAK